MISIKHEGFIAQQAARIRLFNASALAAPAPNLDRLPTNWAGSALNISNAIVFSLMWAFVGIVSIYDAYLCLRYWDCMQNMEQNPICLYLMTLGDGDASIFLRCKAAGTVLVLAAMGLFYLHTPRLAQRIALGVSSFQFGLLLYLTCWG